MGVSPKRETAAVRCRFRALLQRRVGLSKGSRKRLEWGRTPWTQLLGHLSLLKTNRSCSKLLTALLASAGTCLLSVTLQNRPQISLSTFLSLSENAIHRVDNTFRGASP